LNHELRPWDPFERIAHFDKGRLHGCGGCHGDIRGVIEKHFQAAVA
jgi:hypothetical protein